MRSFLVIPIAVAITVAIALVVVTFNTIGYTPAFLENLLAEAYGVVFDIVIIAGLIEYFQKRQYTKRQQQLLDIVQPKIKQLLGAYRFTLRTIGQQERRKGPSLRNAAFLQPTWEDLEAADFCEKPDIAPWEGDVADYVSWSISRIENELNGLIAKYAQILPHELLKALERLIDHPFAREIKGVKEMMRLNEKYISLHKRYQYFLLCDDQSKRQHASDYADMNEAVQDIRRIVGSS